MSVSRDDLRALLRLLRISEVDEIDCGEFLQRLGAFVEGLGPDGSPPPGCEAVVQHLRVCPECLEEFEVLYRLWCEDR